MQIVGNLYNRVLGKGLNYFLLFGYIGSLYYFILVLHYFFFSDSRSNTYIYKNLNSSEI